MHEWELGHVATRYTIPSGATARALWPFLAFYAREEGRWGRTAGW